jgi:predicted DNA-binding transcriptional regulator YafY
LKKKEAPMAPMDDDLTTTPSRLPTQEMEAIWLGTLMTTRFADAETVATAKRITAALETMRANTIVSAAIDLELEAVVNTTSARSLTDHFDIYALRQASIHESKLTIAYIDAKDRTTKRIIWRLDVQDYGPNGAMLCWCEKRADFRNFRFDRIRDLAIMQKRFEAPRSVMLASYEALRNVRDDGSSEW